MAKLIIVILLNVICSGFAVSASLHFALFTQRDSGDAFWGPVEDFAHAAAKNLDVKLTVFYAQSSRQKMLENLILAKKEGVDAIIFPNFKAVAKTFIEQAEQQKIPVFLFNADISSENKNALGKPQQTYKYWLASLMPDDQLAGYLLGKSLINKARSLELYDENKTVNIIAINGALINSAAELRLAGLKEAIEADGNSALLQDVHAFWKQDVAFYKTQGLYKRYPQTHIYWAASDLMAIGASQALKEKGLIQGKHYLTGGIDWSTEGLEAVKKGEISTSIGGHFMDGAWAVIILHDYFKGLAIDPSTFYLFQSPMSAIKKQNVDRLLLQLSKRSWEKVNFKNKSRYFNKSLDDYQSTPESVLNELQ